MNSIKLFSVILLMVTALLACENKSKENSTKNETRVETQTPPNIVFILSDDQSWTDYSFMGHEQIETPRLDQFASESLTFTRGYVPTSLCSPSLATIITGLYPKDHKILGNDRVLPGDKRVHKKEWRAKNYKPVINEIKDIYHFKQANGG